MALIARFLTSSIGRKALMAVTGLLLIGFLVMHLAANLLIFKSAQAFNEYSHALISNPLIYVAEIGLLVLFIAHLTSGILVTLGNRAARPEGYRRKVWARHTSHKSLASTTMIISGLVVLIFVPLHVAGFKFGKYYASANDPHLRDLARLVVETFQNPGIVGFYAVVMTLIGFHLWHGFGSALETLGARYRKPVRWLGQIIALALAGGFVLIPVLIYLRGGAL